MASLTLTLAARPAAFTSQQRPRSSRRSLRCLAATDKEQEERNRASALGFTEKDSAGQTNIFAVEPKSYVAGTSADTTSSGSQATLLVAGVAALASAAVLGSGLVVDNSVVADLAALAPPADAKSLTAYSKQFAAELGPAKSAPALTAE